MAERKEKVGYFERARRRAAVATVGEEGVGTTTKRGMALIGGLIAEALSPSKSMPSRKRIAAAHQAELGA